MAAKSASTEAAAQSYQSGHLAQHYTSEEKLISAELDSVKIKLETVEKKIADLGKQQARLESRKAALFRQLREARLAARGSGYSDSSLAVAEPLATSTPCCGASPQRQRIPGVVCFTPAPSSPGIWEYQRHRRRRSPPPPLPVLSINNRFDPLNPWTPQSPVQQPPKNNGRTGNSKPHENNGVLIIGDSIVRHVNCGLTRGKSQVCCLPGARVSNIAQQIPSILNKHQNIETIIVHAGVNDIRLRQSEVLKEHFITLVNCIKDKSQKTRIIISGPLPTYKRGCEPYSRLLSLNAWLRWWCAEQNMSFIDNWDVFWERPCLYRRDGLHPNRHGAMVLSDNIRKVVQAL